jgi:uncharacterized protein YecE (DUF72 family)
MVRPNPRAVARPAAPGRVLAGTSGYDYDPWRGKFYPPGLPRAQRLTYYASRFPALEINASFYRKPSLDSVRRWAAEVPETFRFALKAWQRITHQKRLRDCGQPLRLFAEAARALGGKLGPILYQLPPNLQKDLPLLRDFLAALPPDLRAAFEFRHDSWQDEEVHETLRAAGSALCVAETDEGTMPLVRTAPFGYLRLRRAAYDARTLGRWAKRIAEAGFSEDVYVFFKHEDEARGPLFALTFDRLARAAQRPPARPIAP